MRYRRIIANIALGALIGLVQIGFSELRPVQAATVGHLTTSTSAGSNDDEITTGSISKPGAKATKSVGSSKAGAGNQNEVESDITGSITKHPRTHH
jgi:hypothetical protein